MIDLYIWDTFSDRLRYTQMPMRINSKNLQGAFKFSAHRNMSVAVSQILGATSLSDKWVF